VRGSGEAVRVLPSVVDTTAFRPGSPGREAGTEPGAPPPGGGGETPLLPTLGWVGSNSTLPYLERLAPALAALREQLRYRLLVVAGGRRPHLPGVPYDYERWTPAREVACFQELDVGLYPLDDTPWSRGKCGFKAIQYLACGVPCVASPVGVLREIVRPGETGLHATDTASWTAACARLLQAPEERARMGREGRERVVRDYSVQAAVETLVETLDEVARPAGRAT